MTPSRQRKSFTTKFKLEVITWWNHARIQDGPGIERPPNVTLRARNLPNSMSDCQPEPVRMLERRSGRLAGVQRQYVVAELFPSLADMEDEDDGVEFCWREEDGE